MAFTRVRTINGKQYLYREERWREGGKVRSRSTSLGPADGMGFIRRQLGVAHGINWDAIEREQVARMHAADEQHAERQARVYLNIGLTMPSVAPGVAVEKPAPMVDLNAPEATPGAEQENAPQGGEAEVSGTPDQ